MSASTTTHAARATTAAVITLDNGTVTRRTDTLAGEEPLQIRVAGPDHDAIDIASRKSATARVTRSPWFHMCRRPN